MREEPTAYIVQSIAAAVLLLTAQISLAGSATWLSSPQDSAWENANNWTPGGPPNGPSDIATFDQSSQTDVNISTPAEVNSIVFTSNSASYDFSVLGGQLTISGTGVNNNNIRQNFLVANGGNINFNNASTAGSVSIHNSSGNPAYFTWGSTIFNDASSAANASIFNEGSPGLLLGGPPGDTAFTDTSTAGHATITNGGAGYGGAGGRTDFYDLSTADSATLIGRVGDIRGGGGLIVFNDASTAGNAIIIANGDPTGEGANGAIIFYDSSTGGTARVKVFDNGDLDIRDHQSSVTVGSIEGSGNVFLGANNLTVGTNGINTSFSGVIWGSGLLAKVGSGVLTLQADDCIADTVGLILVSGSIIKLDFTGPPDAIASLKVNGVPQPPGIYGSPTSGAPHQLPQFAGPGTVQVGIVTPPGIATNTASNVTSFSATLNGTVNPNGSTANVHFQYGTTTSYGSTTASRSYTGGGTQPVSANIAGLSPNTTYHFRLVGTNIFGTTYGSDRTFTTLSPTGPPVVTTNPASNISTSSATLNGSLNPHGLTTTVYFQYGTTTSYGRSTPSQIQAGNTYRSISANISGLPANSAYHFRIVATNSAGSRYGADRVFTIGPNDFNNDGHPDYLLFNPTTRGTVIWYMNNNLQVGAMYGPPVPEGWEVVGVADFNLGSRTDYLLFEPATRSTVIFYMNNNVRIGSTYGPTLPSGWSVGALGDFNGDGYPDYLLSNASTGGTVVWYLRNNVHIGSAPAPTIPGGWSLRAVADFNGDGRPDYLLFSPVTRQTVIWYLSGATYTSSATGPTIEAGWEVVGAADFDHNARPDYVLYNSGTHQTAIWYLNNNIFLHNAGGPTLPAGWTLVAP
jgi:hypothetical protein